MVLQRSLLEMRHTIAVRGSKKLKNGQLIYYLPSMQDGECVKLSQNSSFAYLIYRVAQSMSPREATANEHLLVLNGLESDAVTSLQPFNPSSIEHLKVQVSSLDWKIINLNQIKIAESFLEQISVVWPNAYIPIYYDDSNFVVLRAVCDNPYRLNINTTVQFIEQKQNRAEEQSQLSQEEPFQTEIILSTESKQVRNGYLNRVFLSPVLKERLKIQPNFWIVQNRLEFSHLPSISQFLQLEKKLQKNQKDYQLPSIKKLILIETEQSIEQEEYSCSRQCQQLLKLSQRLYISSKQIYRPSIESVSLQLFLNDLSYSVSINPLSYNLQGDNELQSHQHIKQMQQIFAHHILNTLFNLKQFYILQSQYPYLFDGSLYLITLRHKTNAQVVNKLHRLAFIGKNSAEKKEQYFNQLIKDKITFNTPNSKQPMLLYKKYQQISRWIKVIQQNEKSKELELKTESELRKQKIFQIIYNEEIHKIISFISSSVVHKICVVCSYGSNGKSFLHEYLKRRGHRMWMVNFQQLNSPSLSFKQIDFYLQWIFANSPYNTIYIDDIDSLCSKVEEGDQQRKREKLISKLLLRKINQYINIYQRKVIVTAKTDSNVDEEIGRHMSLMLKNPNRQLRLRSLIELSRKHCQDSPIKKIKEQELSKNQQDELQEIAEATQSLTFANYITHALNFTKPKNTNSLQLFDFSKIAGLKTAKSTIKSVIEKPIKYSFLFKTVPIKLPRGILLYGATGNGKSALGLAARDEFKMKYFSVKGSDILSKYIGGSEAAVRDIFEKALSVSPSIIFFDEFQSIVPRRNSNNTGVNDRIVNQFLCYLDGVSAISGVYIIAASSRPDLIDPAVLRPGRLDAHIFLDYPTPEERFQLIKLFEKSVKMDVEENQIIDKTAGFSYSDLIGLFKELRIKRSAEVLKCQNYKSEDFIQISQQLFNQTLSAFKLSVQSEQQRRQRQIYTNFRDGVSPDVRAQRQVQY